MRTRAKLITSAVLVLGLVLGSLLGGVLRDGDAASGALPASSGSTAFAADRVLTGIASAGGGADVRELERTVRAEPERRTVARTARLRVPAALARDGRRLQPASLRGRAPARAAPRPAGPARRDGPRLARADPTRLSLRARPRSTRPAPRTVERPRLRGRRRRADRARPLRGGVPRLRADGRAPAERGLLRPDRVRP